MKEENTNFNKGIDIRNEDVLNLLLSEIKKGITIDKLQDEIQKILWHLNEERMVNLATIFDLKIKVQ